MWLPRGLNTLIERVFMLAAGTLFAVFVATIFHQVLARNLVMVSARRTDEVALMCFVWSVFLGAAVRCGGGSITSSTCSRRSR